MMLDEIFTLESFISWGDIIGMGSLEYLKGSGTLQACSPSFGELEPPLVATLLTSTG